jgi:hypothetical protein
MTSVYHDAPIPTESERVEAWRLEQALNLGVPLAEAEQFAASDGDLHRLADLIISRGCAPALAAEITT